jgi:hypothetical protein
VKSRRNRHTYDSSPPLSWPLCTTVSPGGLLNFSALSDRPAEPPSSPADESPGLAAFIESTTEHVLEPWQRIICDRLERLKDETGVRLLIHGPPQFGKSIIISQRFPAWLIGRDPKTRLRIACYNEEHAKRFTASNLQITRSPQFRQAFPGVGIPSVASEKDWSTLEREALADGQPTMRALGVKSGFTGLGADTLIIDDPYKDKADAFSPAYQKRIWDFWTETVSPRLNPKSNVVVMFHRWKEDDLAGRLLETGRWETMRFPAICDGGDDDPTYTSGLRAIGDPLSERFSVEYLETEVKSGEQGIGEAAFESLYQGNPKPRGGLMFRAEWFAEAFRVDQTPVDSPFATSASGTRLHSTRRSTDTERSHSATRRRSAWSRATRSGDW